MKWTGLAAQMRWKIHTKCWLEIQGNIRSVSRRVILWCYVPSGFI